MNLCGIILLCANGFIITIYLLFQKKTKIYHFLKIFMINMEMLPNMSKLKKKINHDNYSTELKFNINNKNI